MSEPESIYCLGCGILFYPMPRTQKYCTPECKARHQKKPECWICERTGKYIQEHHVIKRRLLSDYQDSPTINLCRGCHWLVRLLAQRKFLSDPKKLADLITLARMEASLPDARTIIRYEIQEEGGKQNGKT